MRIATRIAALSIASVSITLAVAGWLFTAQLQGIVIERTKNSLNNQIYFRLTLFEHGIEEMKQDALLLGNNQLIREHLNAPNNIASRAPVKSLLKQILLQNPDYVQVRLLDTAGLEFLRVDRVNLNAMVIPKQQLQDKSHHPYFVVTKTLAPGQIYLSPINLNREHGEIAIPHQAMIRAATPIYQGQKWVGIAVINKQLDGFLHSVISRQQQETVALINPDGYFIAHSAPNITFGFELNPHNSVQNLNPEYLEFLDTLTPNKRHHILLRQSNSFESLDTNHFLIASRYQYNNQPKDYFTLVITTPASWLNAQIADLFKQYIFTFFAVLVVSGSGAIAASRAISRGIRRLRKESHNIAEGARDVDIGHFGNDEVGELARDIRTMAVTLAANECELRDNEALQRALLQTLPCGIVVIDKEGNILLVNQWLTTTFGYTEKELVGANISILMHASEATNHSQYLAKYVATESTHIIGHGRKLLGLRRNGDSFPVKIVVAAAIHNGKQIFVGSIEDLSGESGQD